MVDLYAGWCNGSTRDFGSLCLGSNPSPVVCGIQVVILFKNSSPYSTSLSSSSMVELAAVNRSVVGSNPTWTAFGPLVKWI